MKVGAADVDALVFDFDGTLADSMWVWEEVDRQFLEKRGIPYDVRECERIAVLGFEAGSDYVVAQYGLDENPEDIIEEWKSSAADHYASSVLLKEGAEEYLKRCKSQDMPMAIATSLQRPLLEAALKNNGILELFDALCVCDELHCNGKSNPTVYLEAARQLGIEASRCAIFEDVVTPARSAKQTGAYVVGVYDAHKQQATDELRDVTDFFIESWNDLL